MTASEQRELIELWLLAAEGAADEVQLGRLNQWIESDAEARACVLDVSRQQGWLAWNAAEMQLPAAIETLSLAKDQPAVGAIRPAGAVKPAVRSRSRWAWAAMAASLLGFFAGYWYSTGRHAAEIAADGSPLIQATMVSSTGCVWGPGNATNLQPGRGLAGGDSLQLLEGIAEFRIGVGASDVQLQLEGPVSMVLTAHGAASMSYGKIIVRTGELHVGAYPIETSFGRVLAEPESEIGLIGFGSMAEIHCFRGRATIESPWLRSNEREVTSVALEAGEALEFEDVGGATLLANRGAAEKHRFTPQVSMSTDFLSVGPEYVREVVAAKPVAYWRFEESPDGVVRNEMGDAYAGRVKGEVGWAGPEGNRAIELGVDPKQGSIVADESWDEVLRGDFSIELWMKPSHHHLGSMVGFVGEFDPVERRNRHGVLLETCGPSNPSDWLRLNQLRFLHRSQLTALATDGVSCFSDRPYDARRWQHVVAVKNGAELRLYLDGKLVQTARDESPTPAGLHLVMGQLYTETVERFFIGHLDEVAIYARPLTGMEIRSHYELLRPSSPVAKEVL